MEKRNGGPKLVALSALVVVVAFFTLPFFTQGTSVQATGAQLANLGNGAALWLTPGSAVLATLITLGRIVGRSAPRRGPAIGIILLAISSGPYLLALHSNTTSGQVPGAAVGLGYWLVFAGMCGILLGGLIELGVAGQVASSSHDGVGVGSAVDPPE